jgi:hypothetical protein
MPDIRVLADMLTLQHKALTQFGATLKLISGASIGRR